jgi:hypothetical protein
VRGTDVDPGGGFVFFFAALLALLASNLNNAAVAMSRMKSRLSRCIR